MTDAGESEAGSELEVQTALAQWSGEAAAAHVAADRGLAIDRLPGDETLDPFLRLAAAFLAEYAGHSRRAYQADLQACASWCAQLGIHPFDARRHHVAAWNEKMATAGSGRTGKPMAPASIARRHSAVSKFYSHGIGVEVLDHSSVANARRPRVSDDSTTIGLSAEELIRLLDAAETHSARFYALVSLLSYNGLRIVEALAANVDDYTWQRSRRAYGSPAKVDAAPPNFSPHPPSTPSTVTRPAAQRQGPYSSLPTGVDCPTKLRTQQIRRLAVRAKTPAGLAITPHSLRHTFVTEALAAGVPLQDVQDAAGHKDPRTTRRYDRSRLHPDRHPAYVLATHLQRRRSDDAAES